MALSESYDWTLSVKQIATQAYENIGVINSGDEPDAPLLLAAYRRLNGIVKRLQNESIFLWSQEWVTQTLTTSSAVTNGGTTYRCVKGHTSAATDEPGVGANWTTFWVEDSAATGAVAWAITTAYTTIAEFTVAADTIGIMQMFLRDGDDDDPVEIISQNDYAKISTKSNEGKPTVAVFDRQLTPKVYMYKQSDSDEYVVHYQRVRKLQDFDEGSNNFDGPESWLPLVIMLLTYDLCKPHRIAIEERRDIKGEVNELMAMAKRSDQETTDGDFIKGAFD